ncbi:MAG TPA: hypothetical protein IAA06_08970 [Candidatus Blautia faecavium]|uniref:DUF2383 domain-containing protein n=1 Tax=Candidatus Blautia faecavium TaxID=2838487 RepID=A0A9D2LTB8_9FIRM|nr:hypothetical protein [Candidatus Blautia faecavium]
MNANAELLNFVYQNSQMGVDTLGQLIDITDNQGFREYLETQKESYEEYHKKARQMLNENGYDEKGLNAFEKIRTYLMVNLQTMGDNSVSHIAEMLIQGSSMGITDAVKKIHEYEGQAEKDILKLMKELQVFEEKNVEKLKEYL